eukprot:scaffold15144_cov75-Isochrysis_galbana.AAC.1
MGWRELRGRGAWGGQADMADAKLPSISRSASASAKQHSSVGKTGSGGMLASAEGAPAVPGSEPAPSALEAASWARPSTTTLLMAASSGGAPLGLELPPPPRRAMTASGVSRDRWCSVSSSSSLPCTSASRRRSSMPRPDIHSRTSVGSPVAASAMPLSVAPTG